MSEIHTAVVKHHHRQATALPGARYSIRYKLLLRHVVSSKSRETPQLENEGKLFNTKEKYKKKSVRRASKTARNTKGVYS